MEYERRRTGHLHGISFYCLGFRVALDGGFHVSEWDGKRGVGVGVVAVGVGEGVGVKGLGLLFVRL